MYLAAVNFCAFNFGYHVHEKAILMTYIPLASNITSDKDKLRLKILGIVSLWTLLPLIPGKTESIVKHALLIMQIVIYSKYLKT